MRKALILFISALVVLFAFSSCSEPSGIGALEEIEYEQWYWDAEEGQASPFPKKTSDYTIVSSGTTEWKNGTYVVTRDVKIKSRVTVVGSVDLIICNGVKLEIPKGIEVEEYDSLSIYGQDNGIGKLVIDNCADGDAGIGNGGNAGTSIVHCANIDVTGGSNCAAIGGGPNSENAIDFTFYSGIINAVGGSRGAGIGGGKDGSGGDVTIYGGRITATGTDGGAGIGGGNHGAGGRLTIYKSVSLDANGSDGAKGMGGGSESDYHGYLDADASGVPVIIQMSDDSSYSAPTLFDDAKPDVRKQYMRRVPVPE